MRAISLVRAWLYGVRGFVVMTASLAIAFSVAITGPPTNSEIGALAKAFATAASGFGHDLEAAAIQLCPSLPAEMQAVCGGPAPAPLEQQASSAPPPAELAPSPELATPVQLTVSESPAPQQLAASETELLGGPPPRARERAQTSRRASTQRATTSRRATSERAASPRRVTNERRAAPRRATAQRETTQQRASNQRPQPDRRLAERIRAAQQAAQGDLSAALRLPREAQSPPSAPPVSRGDESEHMQSDMGRAMDDYRRMEEAEAAAYRAEQAEQAEYEAWQERRRARREQRRRRYEREYEPPPPEERYYEEDYYPEAEPYPSGGW
jgi:hypothetical protein